MRLQRWTPTVDIIALRTFSDILLDVIWTADASLADPSDERKPNTTAGVTSLENDRQALGAFVRELVVCTSILTS